MSMWTCHPVEVSFQCLLLSPACLHPETVWCLAQQCTMRRTAPNVGCTMRGYTAGLDWKASTRDITRSHTWYSEKILHTVLDLQINGTRTKFVTCNPHNLLMISTNSNHCIVSDTEPPFTSSIAASPWHGNFPVLKKVCTGESTVNKTKAMCSGLQQDNLYVIP